MRRKPIYIKKKERKNLDKARRDPQKLGIQVRAM